IRETSIESSVHLLGVLDTTSDKYQGPITLSGPIEAINPLIPSLTMYGRLVLLDQIHGWQRLRVGDWVQVDGDTKDFMIRARRLFGKDGALTKGQNQPGPTAAPTSTPKHKNNEIGGSSSSVDTENISPTTALPDPATATPTFTATSNTTEATATATDK